MSRSHRVPKAEDDDLKLFKKLEQFANKVALGAFRRNQLFSLCVKASFIKCYEFNVHARRDPKATDAFFSVSSLRGICEDLIVLNYIKRMPRQDREELIPLLMAHDVHSRTKCQDAFFTAARPQQPVLRIKDVESKIGEIESKIQAIWNRHGWPGLHNGSMPQIRQIADKQGQPILARLYDYLYRLTSAGVHFNVQSLLRSGWGTKKNFRFSTHNFDRYFSEYASTYGAFLFVVYFEFFGRFLRPNQTETEIVSEIRKSVILKSRWPEMVTFEEMNLDVPQDSNILRLVYSFMQAEEQKLLIH
jgi:hypothetical protein